MSRPLRVTIGVVLILLGSAAIFTSKDERLLGSWVGPVMGFEVIPFFLLCGGMWLVIRKPAKGDN
jgi:hypothetical protein